MIYFGFGWPLQRVKEYKNNEQYMSINNKFKYQTALDFLKKFWQRFLKYLTGIHLILQQIVISNICGNVLIPKIM